MLKWYAQLACVAGRGYALMDTDAPELKYLSEPLSREVSRYVRFNDGACDSQGRFFAGTICSKDPDIPGQLFCFDPKKGKASLVDPGPFTVPLPLPQVIRPLILYIGLQRVRLERRREVIVSMCQRFSRYCLRRARSYLTDSLKNRIYVYDYNDGELSNRRLFVDALIQGLPEGTFPDGLCLDSEGCIWSARWLVVLLPTDLSPHLFTIVPGGVDRGS